MKDKKITENKNVYRVYKNLGCSKRQIYIDMYKFTSINDNVESDKILIFCYIFLYKRSIKVMKEKSLMLNCIIR